MLASQNSNNTPGRARQFTSSYKASIDGFDIRGGDQQGFPGNINDLTGGPTGLPPNIVTQGGAIFANAIVDVRLKIVDPDKASALLRNQAALLVGDQQTLWYCYVNAAETPLILAPHMHTHSGGRLKKLVVMFFPTQQTIHMGSEVSLVFGSVRTEPIAVR